MSTALEDARQLLLQIDTRIVQELAARQKITGQLAAIKADADLPMRDESRESAVLEHVAAEARRVRLDPELVIAVYRAVLEHSVRGMAERTATRSTPRKAGPGVRVSYQGSPGAYSYLAAQRHFAGRQGDLGLLGFTTFQQLLEAVQTGEADYGMLPVENTTAGSINEAYDLLASADLAAVGEEILRIEHCLVTLEPIPLSQVRRVASHPQALAQCSEFLASLPDCSAEAYHDTAMAVQKVIADQDLSQAAIASQEAAELYGLHVVERHIANQAENFTRFLVVAREPAEVRPGVPCKTSMVLATRHEKGALVRCLNVLAERGVNLSKLESRPRPNTPWEYLFYVDVDGNVADPGFGAALEELEPVCSFLKVFGSYPACPEPEPGDG